MAGHGHPRNSDEHHVAGAQSSEGRRAVKPWSQGVNGYAGRGKGRKQKLFLDS